MFVTESTKTVDLSQIMINDNKLLVELQTSITLLQARQKRINACVGLYTTFTHQI